MATLIDIVVQREMGEIVHYLPHKKILAPSSCRNCVDHAQNLPGPAPNIWLTVFQISYKSVHFQRSFSRMHEGVLLPHRIFLSLSKWINNNNNL